MYKAITPELIEAIMAITRAQVTSRRDCPTATLSARSNAAKSDAAFQAFMRKVRVGKKA
jgi:hypothetical protein